jgi:glycolate oxidase
MMTEPQSGAGELARRLIEAVGENAVRTELEDRTAYAYDGFGQERAPSAVVLPSSVRDVSAVVRIAAALGEPVVARGAGTGLCGGAVAARGGVVLSFARMNRILSLDVRNRRARVQPGLINLDLSRAVSEHQLFYAPDPSSQKISTIGGNVATNAGGPHCLSYGTTASHVLGVEFVDATGGVIQTSIDDPGYDLTGVLVGSEGTLGIVTAVDVRLLRVPEAVRVCVAAFADVEAASAAVSAIIGAGIVPTALEIMDAVITHAVEAHFHAGYPAGAGAVLLTEIAGSAADMDAYEDALKTIALAHGSLSWRAARSARERDILWAARKGAAGAIGRIAPNYYIQDATVPRTRLPQALKAVDVIAADHGLRVGNVFHAGDGNLHPLLLFDRRKPAELEAVSLAGHEILKTCIAFGGTVSGEHGIGLEKRDALPLVFSQSDLATMLRVRDAFDPMTLLNPDKIFPAGAVCGEVRRPHAVAAAGASPDAWV